MFSNKNIAIVVVIVVLLSGILVIKKMGDSKSSQQANQQIMPPLLPEPTEKKDYVNNNPLLTATRVEMSRWFPSFCFSEVYIKEDPWGNREGCIHSVIDNIKAETGIELTRVQVLSPDVIAHFKKLTNSESEKWLN